MGIKQAPLSLAAIQEKNRSKKENGIEEVIKLLINTGTNIIFVFF